VEAQRRELEQILAETLAALAEATAGNVPLAQEQGLWHARPAGPWSSSARAMNSGCAALSIRVDRGADGRLCIIDYKSGSAPIAARDLLDRAGLQIALYALAARDALAWARSAMDLLARQLRQSQPASN